MRTTLIGDTPKPRASCGPALLHVLEVAGPVRLQQMPLVRGTPDQALELGGDRLGDPGDVLLDRPLARGVERPPDDAAVRVALEEVGADHDRGTGPKGQRGRAGRQRRALPE